MGGFFLEAFIAFCWGNRLIAQFWVLVAGGRIHGLIVDLMILLMGGGGGECPLTMLLTGVSKVFARGMRR